jgi:hypothetical protein
MSAFWPGKIGLALHWNRDRADVMAEDTFYQLLDVSKEKADEIAKMVRESLLASAGPEDWAKRLIEQFHISPECGEIFVCGWLAGRYAGASEVFSVVQREMDKMEKDKSEKERRYPAEDGYA